MIRAVKRKELQEPDAARVEEIRKQMRAWNTGPYLAGLVGIAPEQ